MSPASPGRSLPPTLTTSSLAKLARDGERLVAVSDTAAIQKLITPRTHVPSRAIWMRGGLVTPGFIAIGPLIVVSPGMRAGATRPIRRQGLGSRTRSRPCAA